MSKKNIIWCVFIYMIFSISSVLMKLASQANDIIPKFILFGASIGILVFFSLLWQKILQKSDLIKPYLFKSTTIIWGLIFGIMIFGEVVTWNMIIGVILTMIGVIFTVQGGKQDE